MTRRHLLAALFAGLVSFLSPCVLPLVPPYLVYLAGTSLERLADDEPEPRVKRETVVAAVLFVAGFSTVFVALGASASAIGALIRAYSGPLATVAGIVIIVMGLHFLGGDADRAAAPAEARWKWQSRSACGALMRWAWRSRSAGRRASADPRGDPGGGGVRGTVAKGAGLLAVYSLGLGIPFLDRGLRGRAVRGVSGALRRPTWHRVEQAMGGLLVLTGIAFLTGCVNQMSVWLLEAFPALGRIG